MKKSNELPMAERPAVKLAYFGAKALSNSELLSLVIGGGTKNSLELADNVLDYAAKNLDSLDTAEVSDLCEVYGVGGGRPAQ